MKKELTDKFLPCNTLWVTREAFKKFKHSGTVRDYIKKFSLLMLDVRNMFEEDKLFNFLSGLQPWENTELIRRDVKNLPATIAAVDALVDFAFMNASSSSKKKKEKNTKMFCKFKKKSKKEKGKSSPPS